MKAIFVKWIAPSHTKGTRLKAFDGDGNSVTISRHEAGDFDGVKASRVAAVALCKKMGWNGYLIGGGHKNVDAFCFVPINETIKVLEGLRAGRRDGGIMGDASNVLDDLKEDFVKI